MEIFGEILKRGHEQLALFSHPESGLKAIVAIHNTVLGPALGGCRMRLYSSEEEAIEDCLRLAEGMTYKSSLAGLDLGGGKSCIIADPKLQVGRRELFRQFGIALNGLAGRYVTAEDMGTSVADMSAIRETSNYVAGGDPESGGSGDPSPWTALGVFEGIKAAVAHAFGSDSLKARRVAIQGVGNVGRHLARLLFEAGASLIVTDSNSESCQSVKSNYSAEVASLDGIYDVEADVFAPCAVGQTINKDTISRLKAKIIAGAANNQLSDSSVYSMIEDKNLIYCPDFAINAGGIISVGAEYLPGGWKRDWVNGKAVAIGATVARILKESRDRKVFPEIVALDLARERIKLARR